MAIPNPFFGRSYEFSLLEAELKKTAASLIVVYGRRRVGKTRLIAEFYKDKELWKFDGVEGEPRAIQIQNMLEQLSVYSGDEIYRSIKCASWLEFVKILDRAMSNSNAKYKRAVFLDEFPYMCSGKTDFISAIKWAWDNLWSDKAGFNLVLCGSIAAFMVKKVVKSSALYGRINLEICLKPLSVREVYEFFGKKRSIREICDLYMFCGGIPEYLNKISKTRSVSQNIAQLAFCKDGYFVNEFDRLFKDIFKKENIYKRIVLELCKFGSLKGPEIAESLSVSTGGGFVKYMEYLELAGFAQSFSPLDKTKDSKLKRYKLSDEYLLFYFKFIYPNLKKIQDNTAIDQGLAIFHGRQYKSWAGFAFERLCIKHAPAIIKHLKIDQLVKNYGAYFDRKSNSKNRVQIDLLFERYDSVLTICELKYYDGLIGKWIIDDVERKVNILGETKKTVEKVLITTNGVTKDLAEANYFSRVVLIDELFG